jgi:hypothetical protein
VTIGASARFLVALSFAQINAGWLVARLVGGSCASSRRGFSAPPLED